MLYKTNTKGHKHTSIRLLAKSKTQLVNQRKQKVAFSPGTAHSPEIQSYRTWWGAASPILNDTPVVYTTYNRTRIRNAHISMYIHINTELLDGNQGHQEETLRPTHRFRRLFLEIFIGRLLYNKKPCRQISWSIDFTILRCRILNRS